MLDLKKKRWLLTACLAVFSLLLFWCGYIFLRDDEEQEPFAWEEYQCILSSEHTKLSFRGVLQCSVNIPVVSKTNGRITELVKQGTEVKKGDLLFSIDDTSAREEIENLQNNVDSSELALEQYRANYELVKFKEDNNVRQFQEKLAHAILEENEELAKPTARDLRLMELDEQTSQLNVEDAEDAYEREKRMYDKGYITLSALEPYQRSLENKRAELEELKLKNQIERKGISDERRVELRKAVERAQSNLERIGQRRLRRLQAIETLISSEQQNLEVTRFTIANAQKQIDNASIYAPSDGVFKLLTYRDWTAGGLWREVQVGDEKRREDVIGHIIDPSDMIVKMVVNESDFPQLKVGMPVKMEVPALPGKVFSGKISQLGAIGKDRNVVDPMAAGGGDSEVIMFNASVEFDGSGVRFHPGMSATINVSVEASRMGLYIPRAAVMKNGEKWQVYVDEEMTLVDITGQPYNEMAFRVAGGLKEGDRIFIRRTRQK